MNMQIEFYLQSVPKSLLKIYQLSNSTHKHAIFGNYSVNFYAKNHLCYVLNITMHIQGDRNKQIGEKFWSVAYSTEDHDFTLHQLVFPIVCDVTYEPTNGTIEGTPVFDKKNELVVLPAIISLTEGEIVREITSPSEHTR